MGEQTFGINNATASLCGVSLLLLGGVLSWDDCLSERSGWDCFLWFSIMIALASGLESLGVMQVTRTSEGKARAEEVAVRRLCGLGGREHHLVCSLCRVARAALLVRRLTASPTRVRYTGTAQVVSASISGSIAATGTEWPTALACLLGVYTYSHYFFASTTAQVSLMYPAFLAVAVACEIGRAHV